ncbi:MAG: amino acid adenylation domain-containing protein [Acidobacteriia bacterium]|nr:amino acid adenylation domain-containing protein [Terriglobia bacterium]
MKAISRHRAELSPIQKRNLLGELMGHGATGVRLCPLSLAQQRLWFLEQLEPGTPAYNISSGLRLRGALDDQALRRSVARIVARHETLRTAFLTLGGEVLQRISPIADVEIPAVDLRALPDEAREREAYQAACEEASRPFDLQASPLLRLKLMRMRDEEHILLFTMHHLVSDGWSIGVFVEELIELYEADIQRRPSQLPPVRIQYADYAEWQRESLDDQELVRQSQYWKTRLAGIESRLELPVDRVRPAEQSFLGGAVSVPVPAPLIEGLKGLAQREGTTLFTVLLAAFNVLLHRYSQQEDICIGVPVAGRSLLETETLIGLFVNTLVIRTDLSGNPKFRDLLAEVRDTSLEAHANQDLPFEKIVEELQPKRSLTHNPVFQVMMTALKEPLRNRNFAALTASQYTAGASSSLFDLTVFVVEAADGSLWWRFQYSTALFDPARIRRMIGHYQTLLINILQNPDRRIGDLALLTSQELEQFAAWNGAIASYPRKCVHALIADQAARSPDRVAVVFEEKQLTYAELHHQSLRVVTALRAAGAGPGSLVAISLDRSLEMIVGVLGVLQSGAAYVPLDPADPAARISFKMEDSGAAILLTQGSLAARLSGNAAKCVLIEDALAMAAENAVEAQDPESLAYVVFTSGSTGQPKGVCVAHRALVNLLSSMQRRPGLAENDRLLAVTNLCFDISALELFLPLITGARLVVAGRETPADGLKLLENLRRYGITIMQATPSTWRMLVEAGWSRASCKLKVLCGGEALPADLANELTRRSDSVWNLYGPTETTVWSSLGPVTEHGPVTIGRPIQNTRFYVLDRRMRRVPVGAPGELYIGGEGLANGYLNRPELTNERFVANPFDADGGKLYRTGDEVRYRADGEIEYLGRLDFQVKVRGHRIELGEVESMAVQHLGVRQALAIVREDKPGDQRLVCYVVPERGAAVSASELRAAIKDKLPDFMIPAIVVLESLPLTENGKIDLVDLPAPAEERSAAGEPGSGEPRSSEPRNEVERQLLAIWKQVLRLDELEITDNFFDLGGHSLLAMRLLAEIDRVFGRRLPVATVFRAQTVEQMAAVLSQRSPKPWSSLVTLQPHGLRPPLFVVPAADGNVLAFADLARSLGPDQPVHVLQPVGFEGHRKPLERIEEIAEYFIGEIRKVQPRGPYRLAGFCVGGVVAFEMAQQLIASGEEPPLLALVETWHPRSVPVIRGAPVALRPWIFLVRGLGRHLGVMLSLPPREVFRYFRENSVIVKEMILRRDVYREDRYKRYRDLVWEANYRAGSRYIPAAYAGRILLFLAGNRKVEADSDTRLAWCELARDGCEVVRTTAGDLMDFLKKPHVKALADKLAEQLRESPGAAGASSIYGLVS